MTLIELRNSDKINTVIWTCNLFTFGGIDEKTKTDFYSILVNLLDLLISKQKYTYKEVCSDFNHTVSELEKLLKQKPLEDGWIYEYGGLNDFFVEIMLVLGFYVKKGQYYWAEDFVYDSFADD